MKRLLAVLATALILASAPVAAHADDQLGLSTDQTTWAPDLTTALFPDSVRWVPGDARTASFWVRNQAADPGALTITATRAPAGEGVDVQARVAGGDWVPVTTSTTLAAGTVAPGATRRVDVRVVFDSAAGNATQARDFPASFRATLVQTGAGVPAPEDEATEDEAAQNEAAQNEAGQNEAATTAELAGTGSDLNPRLILAAVGALGTGGLLLLASRRRHEEEDDS